MNNFLKEQTFNTNNSVSNNKKPEFQQNSFFSLPTMYNKPITIEKKPVQNYVVSQQKSNPNNVLDQSQKSFITQQLEVNTNDKIDITNLHNDVNSLKEMINILACKIDQLSSRHQSPLIYVACNLHNHLLVEVSHKELGDAYKTGFICDNCKYQQTNITEKFYHCPSCPSLVGQGLYDLCYNCVKNCLNKK